jgi:hypothetical protein
VDVRRPLGDAREDLDPGGRHPDGVQPRHRCHAARLHDLELPDDRIPAHRLGKPEDAVRDGEDRVPHLVLLVFPNEERRRFPGRQSQRQPLHEMLQLELGTVGTGGANQRPERIDDHDAGTQAVDLCGNASQHCVEIPAQRLVAQVHEVHIRADAGQIEEAELLLVAQHLERGLAQQCDEESGPRGGGVGEQQLHRQRRLARAGAARDQVERQRRQAATEDVVQPGDAGVQQRQGRPPGCRPLPGMLPSHRALSRSRCS